MHGLGGRDVDLTVDDICKPIPVYGGRACSMPTLFDLLVVCPIQICVFFLCCVCILACDWGLCLWYGLPLFLLFVHLAINMFWGWL